MIQPNTMNDLIKETERSRRFVVGVVGFFVLGYMIWFVFINNQELSIDAGDWGTFGDFLGGILNPLIAYLALYWLTKSIVIQRSELEATRILLSDQVNSAKKESVRIQLREYMEDEYKALTSILKSYEVEPFNFEYNDEVVGISSFEQLKTIFFSSDMMERMAFLDAINLQAQTFYGSEDDNNRRRNKFNRVLQQISISIEHFAEYIFLFVDVSEIHKMSERKLDDLSGLVDEAYQIGAISLIRHNEIIDQVNAKLGLSKKKHESFKAFLKRGNDANSSEEL